MRGIEHGQHKNYLDEKSRVKPIQDSHHLKYAENVNYMKDDMGREERKQGSSSSEDHDN